MRSTARRVASTVLAALLLLRDAAGYSPTWCAGSLSALHPQTRRSPLARVAAASKPNPKRGSRRVATAADQALDKWTAPAARDDVVEDSTTFRTVESLNALSLSDHRCHSVTSDASPEADPFGLVADELLTLSEDVRAQLHGRDETLGLAASHFFGTGHTREGKRVRPVIVLLMARATALAGRADTEGKQRRLASITEMIHTASLVHDDVLDAADTRRGGSAVHKKYTTRAAVLGGDFLLARASVALAQLDHVGVTQEMAKSLEALVQGEIMQLKSTAEERLSLDYYLTKSYARGHSATRTVRPPGAPLSPEGRHRAPRRYCKTASLMAFSCKSAALLSGHAVDSTVATVAEKCGGRSDSPTWHSH
jgi:geranyl diphosphate synthase